MYPYGYYGFAKHLIRFNHNDKIVMGKDIHKSIYDITKSIYNNSISKPLLG